MGLQVDVYAFSMIAYELFEGAIPFEHLHPVEAARRAAMNHARPVWGKPYNRSVPCLLSGFSPSHCAQASWEWQVP